MAFDLGDAIEFAGDLFEGVTDFAAGESNARSSKEAAKREREKKELELERQRKLNRRIKGEQIVAFGAAGVSSMTGTAKDILADSFAEGELDLRLIEKGGELAENLALSEARQFRRAGRRSLGGALLGGLTFIADEVV